MKQSHPKKSSETKYTRIPKEVMTNYSVSAPFIR